MPTVSRWEMADWDWNLGPLGCRTAVLTPAHQHSGLRQKDPFQEDVLCVCGTGLGVPALGGQA